MNWHDLYLNELILLQILKDVAGRPPSRLFLFDSLQLILERLGGVQGNRTADFA